jgi:uncharacterized protein
MGQPSWIIKDKVYEYVIDCWNTSHVFKKDHRIRVEISSSAFPKYDRNLNTKTNLGTTTEAIVARQTVFHSEVFPSAILLPIIPNRV